ncbi:MAG: hydroxymethylglutaryl-CoA reductase, degradative, partial [Oligoflexia bacterium]|nr:hydroxymethylglutaryl-CoA reductase, degradative [Oligoflexia bacterium]
LSDGDLDILEGKNLLDLDLAEGFVENLIGIFPLPLGLATYFRIDGKDIPIPMAIEETSVIAACSGTAKWILSHEGSEITTSVTGRNIIGQIQFPSIQDPENTVRIIKEKEKELLTIANSVVPGLVRRGGGVTSINTRLIYNEMGRMLVLHILMDPCDAMGANLINQVCEGLKPILESWTGEKIGLCILSNLVDTKITTAKVRIRNINPEIGKGIESASLFAEADPYRAATHNKGVMNGIDPLLIATGNDWRAVEAGIHAYCSRSGDYQPVTTWRMDGLDLVGTFSAPLVVGTVGGVTKLHPTAQICLRILGVNKADDLSRIIAAVGLVQNLGALRALSTVGIVKGHMSLHATNLALAAGAKPTELIELRENLVASLKKEKNITMTRARELLDRLRGVRPEAP